EVPLQSARPHHRVMAATLTLLGGKLFHSIFFLRPKAAVLGAEAPAAGSEEWRGVEHRRRAISEARSADRWVEVSVLNSLQNTRRAPALLKITAPWRARGTRGFACRRAPNHLRSQAAAR